MVQSEIFVIHRLKMQSFENVHYGFDCAKQFPYFGFKCNNNKKNNIKSNQIGFRIESGRVRIEVKTDRARQRAKC